MMVACNVCAKRGRGEGEGEGRGERGRRGAIQ